MLRLALLAGVLAANTYSLYILYSKLGMPNMFTSPYTWLSLIIMGGAIFVAGITGSNARAGPSMNVGEAAEGDEVDRIWRQLDNSSPPPHHQAIIPARQDASPIVAAIVNAINTAKLNAEVGLHLSIGKHEVDLGDGIKGELHGSAVFETKQNDGGSKPSPPIIKPEAPKPLEPPPPPEPIDSISKSKPLQELIKEKLRMLEGE